VSGTGHRRRGAMAAALAGAVLAGCANLALETPAGGDTVSGRLAVRVDADAAQPARAVSAAFDLRGSAADGALALSTALGSILGQARWTEGRVTLTTPQGTRAYPDLATMTRDVLGESVPVEAWFDWLRGRPWPGAASQAQAAGFEQLGWSVDVSGQPQGRVVATRTAPPPAVTVRILVE
jgi:outer membrane lipoprotein LolB